MMNTMGNSNSDKATIERRVSTWQACLEEAVNLNNRVGGAQATFEEDASTLQLALRKLQQATRGAKEQASTKFRACGTGTSSSRPMAAFGMTQRSHPNTQSCHGATAFEFEHLITITDFNSDQTSPNDEEIFSSLLAILLHNLSIALMQSSRSGEGELVRVKKLKQASRLMELGLASLNQLPERVGGFGVTTACSFYNNLGQCYERIGEAQKSIGCFKMLLQELMHTSAVYRPGIEILHANDFLMNALTHIICADSVLSPKAAPAA